MTTLAIILGAALWIVVATGFLFMLGIGDGFGRAFGYGGSGVVERAMAVLWPLVLALALVVVPIAWLAGIVVRRLKKGSR